MPLVADLQTRDGLGLVVQRIVGLGTIDLLVNNAGIATFGNFQYSSLEQEMGAIRLNVHAVVTRRFSKSSAALCPLIGIGSSSQSIRCGYSKALDFHDAERWRRSVRHLTARVHNARWTRYATMLLKLVARRLSG